ncbi:sigma-70 family RNA polymerase sigma factor [Streptomyces sp. NPDC002793]|uniref:RNA polymerase sigma factor n=1 Tax=Streptomyces sp. NPDC002793 TaxID=3154432 RepID=UPI00333146C6
MRDHPHTTRRTPEPDNRWELVWSHRDELMEIARRRSSSAEEAEDAVQEAMLRAVEDPDVQYGRVRSWLRRATVSACAERRRQVARDSELSTSPYAAPTAPFPVEEVACDRAEARWLAGRSADLLPARQAEALRLQSQDLDVGQVSRAMGLSYRATESLLARARRSLREVLAGSLTLATAAWLFVRRFPRTGFAQSAVAASAAVTAATVGLSLPTAPPDRPDDRPPRADAPRPAQVTELPAARPAPEHPPAPSPPPAPRRVDRGGQDTPRPPAAGSPTTYEPQMAAAVRIRIGPFAPVPELPSLPVPASPPSLPVPASPPSLPVPASPPSLPVDAPGTLPTEPPSLPPGAASPVTPLRPAPGRP